MDIDYKFTESGLTHVIGIDEVGWGAIAGPLVVGGCIVSIEDDLEWLTVRDSKRYSSEQARLVDYENIRRHQALRRLEYFWWSVSASAVSDLGPARCLRQAQDCVIGALLGDGEEPDKKAGVIVDGSRTLKDLGVPCIAIPRADSLYKVVSAASVVAKVARDHALCKLEQDDPRFTFGTHKGYGTPKHLEELAQNGPVQWVHRFNTAPIKALVAA
jgi:ribonuclease HII